MVKYWVDHIHLYSCDPLKTAEFYEKMLGATREGVRTTADGRTVVDLMLGGTAIKVAHPYYHTLLPKTVQSDSGLDHFGLRTDDLYAAVEELKAEGVALERINEIPARKSKFTYFLGPEDVVIELLERHT